MLKKDSEIKWIKQAKTYFDDTKRTLSQAPILISPIFSKDFMIFSFASEHDISGVLLQKKEVDQEQPISFFSRALRDAELKYNVLDKHAYALIKVLKFFSVFILHSHIIAYVPDVAVKSILVLPESDGRRGMQIAKMLEFDLEIRPTKLIKG